MSGNINVVDDDDSLSLVDVLNEQARLQADASAVLGDSDENNCTYAKGYVQRQAIYACATCSSTAPAGICLACSYHCHEGHELYELYTKRLFRCDCGSSKFPDSSCKLDPTKDAVNVQNKYNQNFHGLYCTCARPYPDSEDEVEDEMIQCVICEDWFHGREKLFCGVGTREMDDEGSLVLEDKVQHLNATVPEDFHEMICMDCMNKHQFLWAYQVDSPTVVLKKEEEDVKVEINLEKIDQISSINVSNMEEMGRAGSGVEDASLSSKVETSTSCTCVSDEIEPVPKRLKIETQDEINGEKETKADEGESTGVCLLKELQQRVFSSRHCASFWEDGWRTKLCTCVDCKKLYEKEEVSFLLDPNDTVQAYEERGKNRTPCVSETDLERGVLSRMNRIQQVELLQGFKELKTELQEFLRGFATSGRVVAVEDIHDFFSRMEAKRRQSNSTPQYFCK